MQAPKTQFSKLNPDKNKVLVTGGAGFIGSHVVDYLIDLNQEVVVLDDLSGGFTENVNDGANFVEGSVTDKTLVDDLFKKEGFDHVFHLAAYAAEGLSHFIRNFNYKNNLIGTTNLLNASIRHDVRSFVFTSSIAVYGDGDLPLTEDQRKYPEDPYGIAKLSCELDIQSAHDLFGIDYIIFRPHNVYGERQNIGDKYRNVVGIFMNKIMKGEEMTIFGNGEQTRAFTYIHDIASVIARSIFEDKALNEVFNIGADEPTSVNELADLVADAMEVEPEVKYLEARNEVQHAYANHSKAKEVFGNYEATSLSEGLNRMAEWAKEEGAKKSDEFKDLEIEKNLPNAWKE